MVEVQVVRAAAFNTAPLVSLPDRKLDLGRNHAVVLEILGLWALLRGRVVEQFELELEDLAAVRWLTPLVDQPEYPIEGPDVRPQFLVDVHELSRITSIAVATRCLSEAPVLA